MADQNQSFSLPFRVPAGVAISVLLLTFIVWVFFYEMDMPLQAGSTTLVAVVMLALVSAAKWLWSRAHPRGGTN